METKGTILSAAAIGKIANSVAVATADVAHYAPKATLILTGADEENIYFNVVGKLSAVLPQQAMDLIACTRFGNTARDSYQGIFKGQYFMKMY